MEANAITLPAWPWQLLPAPWVGVRGGVLGRLGGQESADLGSLLVPWLSIGLGKPPREDNCMVSPAFMASASGSSTFGGQDSVVACAAAGAVAAAQAMIFSLWVGPAGTKAAGAGIGASRGAADAFEM